MKETGPALAGEMLGHLFFAHRWLGFDDAICAGARLLELLSHSTETLSATRLAEIQAAIEAPHVVAARTIAA